MDDLIGFFRSARIPVYKPGEEEYERSVATANLLYRFARPDCVVQPEKSAHVLMVVVQAKTRNIPITIKNGGHSYAGFSTAEKGISLDLARMKEVTLDMDSKTVTLQGGALWGHAYKQLVNGRHDGYIINGGRCPTVGVSGFTLGGGLGPFTRSFGMGCDTLKEATIVTADGRMITVKDTDNPKSNEGRLFWALCGAGGGNFGVVVQMKMKIQQLQNKDGNVVAGRYTWFPKKGEMDEFMRTMNTFYTTDWPKQITIDSSWLCDLKQTESELGVRFLVYYDGNKKDFNKLIDSSIQQEEVKKQLKRRSLSEKSSRFFHETLVVQWSEESRKSFPTNPSFFIYSSFVFKNDRKRMESVTKIIREEMKAFRDLFPGEKALLQVTWIHAGGQASEKKRSATAFRWRDCVYHAYIMIQWEEKFLEMDMWGFLQKFKLKLRPHSMMKRAAFINFPDRALTSNTHEMVYYGNNRQELQRIKEIWDKDNYFNWAHGVRLPQPRETTSRSSRGQAMAANFANMDVNDDEEESGPMALAADGGFLDEEPVVDERGLTDAIAARQWETAQPPPSARNAYTGGGLFGLNDMGF